ncbi:MAG: exosortase C-terminal domain/associated protein EpsI [Candidatus Omnitrophota bacterium]
MDSRLNMFNQRNYLTVIILLSVTLLCIGYIHLGRRSVSLDSASDLSNIPLEIGEWKGKDLSLSERTYEILGTRDVLTREYTNPRGESVGLSIVRSGSDRSAFHPPEICYLGGGLELLGKTVEAINVNGSLSIKANKLVMKDKTGVDTAWYWFRAGNEFTHNFYLQQSLFILNELLRRMPNDGDLIRVSMRTPVEGSPELEERVKRFMREVVIILAKSVDRE